MFAVVSIIVATYVAGVMTIAVADAIVAAPNEFDMRDTTLTAVLWPFWLGYTVLTVLVSFLGGGDDDYYREDD